MKRAANLLVKKIRNNEAGLLIKVKVVLDICSEISNEIELTSQQLICIIEDGDIVKTMYYDQPGHLKIGSLVSVVTVKGIKYLRSAPNSTGKDNLDNLSTF